MIFRITSDPKYWGNGYTSEAAKRVLAFAFEENNVYRVTTGCLAENRGSERVVQKKGEPYECKNCISSVDLRKNT